MYLRSVFTEDVSCTSDIRKRMAKGRSLSNAVSVIDFKKQNISTQTVEGIGLVS